MRQSGKGDTSGSAIVKGIEISSRNQVGAVFSPFKMPREFELVGSRIYVVLFTT